MVIPVYTPRFSVVLTRLVNRTPFGEGFAPTFEQIDVTPFLGTAGAVDTIKDVNAPYGVFSITFADKFNPDFADSIYGLVEPMDLVEIRGTRNPQSADAKLPLIMRGFVDRVSREESMGNDGSPRRMVRITGQDMGKLLEIERVMFEFMALSNNKSYVETYRLQAEIGIEPVQMTASAFMISLVKQVVNPFVQKMSIFSNEQIKPFQTDTVAVPDGTVAPQLAGSIDSVSIWDLMEIFADRPWNELFVQDQEDGPHLVFRPVPFKSYDGDEFIMNGAVDPGTVDIGIENVISMALARSDRRVANFFWVPPGVSLVDTNDHVKISSMMKGYPFDLNHNANNPALFGQRRMQAQTNLQPNDARAVFQTLPPGAERDRAATTWITWVQARARLLLLLNQDNSQFEEGHLAVKGSEDITVGKYLQLTRGNMVSQAYIETVAHQIAPLREWITTLRIIRGNGYRERSKAKAPYAHLSEGFKGPYS